MKRIDFNAANVNNNNQTVPATNRKSSKIDNHEVRTGAPDQLPHLARNSSPPAVAAKQNPDQPPPLEPVDLPSLDNLFKALEPELWVGDAGNRFAGDKWVDAFTDACRQLRSKIGECLAKGDEKSLATAAELAERLVARTRNIEQLLARGLGTWAKTALVELPADVARIVFRLREVFEQNLQTATTVARRFEPGDEILPSDMRQGLLDDFTRSLNHRLFSAGINICSGFLMQKLEAHAEQAASLLHMPPGSLNPRAQENDYDAARRSLLKQATVEFDRLSVKAADLLRLAADTKWGATAVIGDLETLLGCTLAPGSVDSLDLQTLETLVRNRLAQILQEVTSEFKKAAVDMSSLRALLSWELGAFLARNPEARLMVSQGLYTGWCDVALRVAQAVPCLDEVQRVYLADQFVAAVRAVAPEEPDLKWSNSGPGMQGGFGRVRMGMLGPAEAAKPVAVKVQPLKSNRMNDLVVNEAITQARLGFSAHVPNVEWAGADSRDHYLMMDRVLGGAMSGFLVLDLPGDDKKAIGMHFVAGAVEALADLAEVGVLHRDLKPENLMIDNKTLRVFLIDFGAAGPANGKEPFTHATKFGSAEHLNRVGEMTLQSDVYSVGSLLYEVLGGKLWATAQDDALLSVQRPWLGSTNGKRFDNPGSFDERDERGESIWSKPGMAEAKQLIAACWNPNPADRPTAAQLRQAVRGEPVTPAQPGLPGIKGEPEVVRALFSVLHPNHPFRRDVSDAFLALKQRAKALQQGQKRNVTQAATPAAPPKPSVVWTNDAHLAARLETLCERVADILMTTTADVVAEVKKASHPQAVAGTVKAYALTVLAEDADDAEVYVTSAGRSLLGKDTLFYDIAAAGESVIEIQDLKNALWSKVLAAVKDFESGI